MMKTTTDPIPDLGLTTLLAPTPYFLEGIETITSVVRGNEIAVLEGPAGSGKTTTVRFFQADADRPCALATMPGRPAPLDLLRMVYQAIHGASPNPRANRYILQNELLSTVRHWQGVLIVDELQNSPVDSMKDLVWLYEESRHSFALVLVGTDITKAITAYPQLLSRVMGAVRYEALVGDSLVAALHTMDPRYAATPTGVLLSHDLHHCGGILRRWVHTTSWLERLDVPHDEPLTREILTRVAKKMPLWN